MSDATKYNPRYDKSWALVVGINTYASASPLSYACNDASVFAEQLSQRFEFPSEHVKLLLDGDATLATIRTEIAKLARITGDDDRVIVFYAGHGHTLRGNRREAGFLVPFDGNADDTATLLSWDELVSNGNLIRAKHVLYIMDACYSGLIATRKLAPGSARIARDMLSRYSRQYLTAGKADQVVADGGGPRHGHSIFTGHLLDAMDGAVAMSDGIVTANSVIAYVYDRVSKAPHSNQTPHYGWLDGDGDLFFTDPKIDSDPADPKEENDLLIEIPPDLLAPHEGTEVPSLIVQVKEYLSDQKFRIRLDDLVTQQLRSAQQQLVAQRFSVQGASASMTEFVSRLHDYEEAMKNVMQMTVLLGKWADESHQPIIRKIVNVLAGQINVQGGLTVFLGLRWYPMLLATYAGGIGALDAENYRSLQTLFAAEVKDRNRGESKTVLQATVKAILDVDRSDAFKKLPDFENKYTPRSEYLFTRVQPIVEDILFLGTRYEQLFDRFEIFYALNFADLEDTYWGPPGRFAWKYKSYSHGENPFRELLAEANREQDAWGPIRAGMFRGKYARFLEVATKFQSQLLDQLPFY